MQSKRTEVDESTDRAVSPVIGVILMVAITVILAAVIAAFVLDIGQSQSSPVNAVVSVDVSGSGDTAEAKFTVTDMGNAEEFEIRGDAEALGGSGDGVIELGSLTQTGSSQTITAGDSNTGEFNSSASGEYDLSVVAIDGDDESTVATFTVDMD
ncbi:type IV pilin [Natronosalvus amylolyticus]|uniref:type IV pilin n=1 Tax=Natronosalvus amylolyticus TaxID=2961994 RepID=UPI0020CA160C|nr:type IV pilin N-terminal domain-containing protein [Natronosalvus amylolyticus]